MAMPREDHAADNRKTFKYILRFGVHPRIRLSTVALNEAANQRRWCTAAAAQNLRVTQLFLSAAEELSLKDVGDVGGKNASLGEMYRNLKGQGVNGAHQIRQEQNDTKAESDDHRGAQRVLSNIPR